MPLPPISNLSESSRAAKSVTMAVFRRAAAAGCRLLSRASSSSASGGVGAGIAGRASPLAGRALSTAACTAARYAADQKFDRHPGLTIQLPPDAHARMFFGFVIGALRCAGDVGGGGG